MQEFRKLIAQAHFLRVKVNSYFFNIAEKLQILYKIDNQEVEV